MPPGAAGKELLRAAWKSSSARYSKRSCSGWNLHWSAVLQAGNPQTVVRPNIISGEVQENASLNIKWWGEKYDSDRLPFEFSNLLVFLQTLEAFLITTGVVTLVLEEDGTVVDTEEFFQSLDDNTHFVALQKGQKWTQVSVHCLPPTWVEVDGKRSVGEEENFPCGRESINFLFYHPGRLNKFISLSPVGT